MRVNLSDVQGSFDVIPAGRYQARIVEGEIRTSGDTAKHPGSEYINWEYEITEGDFADRKLWGNSVFSHGSCSCKNWKAGSLFTLKDILGATGNWTDEELNSDEFDWEFEEVIGADVTLTVIIKPYQGEDQNEIKKIKPPGQGVSSGAGSLLP